MGPDEGKIATHQRYLDGDISEATANELLDGSLDEIEREREALEETSEWSQTAFFSVN